MIHQLKENLPYFSDVVTGTKTFEARLNDRDYQVGDLLALNEYDPETEEHTGYSCVVQVVYILDEPQYVPTGYVVLGIRPCTVLLGGTDDPGDYSVPMAPIRLSQEAEE